MLSWTGRCQVDCFNPTTTCQTCSGCGCAACGIDCKCYFLQNLSTFSTSLSCDLCSKSISGFTEEQVRVPDRCVRYRVLGALIGGPTPSRPVHWDVLGLKLHGRLQACLLVITAKSRKPKTRILQAAKSINISDSCNPSTSYS